jgi:vanillate O-demethylase ferredoxin subunit
MKENNRQKTLVKSMRQEANGVISIELVSATAEPLSQFSAGGHIDVFLKNDLVRQYSLMNDPDDSDRYMFAVLLEDAGRGGSAHIHNKLRVGDVIDVSDPRNNFELVESMPLHVFVAGGIGITPFMSMADHCQRHDLPFKLYYCARHPESTAFTKLLADRLGEDMHLHFDEGDRSKSIDLAGLFDIHKGAQFYCCGPRGLMGAMESMADDKGESLIIEDFNPTNALKEDTSTNGEGFDVVIASKGLTVHVEQGQSILDALGTVNIEVERSCEAGVCGTCVVGYLEGEPIHNDVVLMPDEQETRVALCVAGCQSRKLVLDL